MKKILSVLLCLVILCGVSACSSDEEETKKDKKDKTEEKKKTEYAIGETAEVKGIKITVNSTRIDEGLFGASDDGTVYFVMDITLENTTDEEFSSSTMLCYTLKDIDGRKQELTIGANTNGSLDTQIEPGEKGTGEIAFKAAPEGQLTLTFKPNSFENDKAKFIVR